MAFLLISGCKNKTNNCTLTKNQQISIDSSFTNNKLITNTITPYRITVNTYVDSIICYTPKKLSRNDGKLESSLGNLLSDVCFNYGNKILLKQINKKADFLILNYGGIRATIPKGNITIKNAYEVMPFENELVFIKINGAYVKKLLTFLVNSKKAHPMSNITLKSNKKQYSNVIINNKKFDEDRDYFILTSDYLQNGGDQMSFFNKPQFIHKTKKKIRTIFIEYLKSTDTITVELDNRFSYEK